MGNNTEQMLVLGLLWRLSTSQKSLQEKVYFFLKKKPVEINISNSVLIYNFSETELKEFSPELSGLAKLITIFEPEGSPEDEKYWISRSDIILTEMRWAAQDVKIVLTALNIGRLKLFLEDFELFRGKMWFNIGLPEKEIKEYFNGFLDELKFSDPLFQEYLEIFEDAKLKFSW